MDDRVSVLSVTLIVMASLIATGGSPSPSLVAMHFVFLLHYIRAMTTIIAQFLLYALCLCLSAVLTACPLLLLDSLLLASALSACATPTTEMLIFLLCCYSLLATAVPCHIFILGFPCYQYGRVRYPPNATGFPPSHFRSGVRDVHRFQDGRYGEGPSEYLNRMLLPTTAFHPRDKRPCCWRASYSVYLFLVKRKVVFESHSGS
uniref:Putative mannan synthase 10 n=1 Tax=Lygus hesperus TaxID=30085 RepID=A0A0A9XTB3_LYGHE